MGKATLNWNNCQVERTSQDLSAILNKWKRLKQHVACVVCRLKDNSVSLEVRIKAEEEVLAEVFRAAKARKLSDPPQLEPCEPLSPVSPMNHTPVTAPPACQLRLCPVFEQEALSEIQAADEQRYNRTPDLKSAKQMMRLVSSLPSSAQIDLPITLKNH